MRTQPKETPINIRAKAFQRELIDHAANLHSKTRTDFILDAACRAAEEVILDQRHFFVDEEKYQAFMQMLEKPLSENEGFKKLMEYKAPWE
ncbi:MULTISPECIES: DUF1778 domain-containing protein [Xenorhabdus]|uniref:type II toxin-antitoxin system TacA family antitoxin n=1 Tax=Xenorhabdus TaxID=626 RepID=UPI00064A60E6|nr:MULTISPECIES: DUF1778 domain-containing protein [Xenorhabdus]KLU17199.1 hypothetical protein AAY47_01950 [Xenorhabdus griffiniae]KOP32725.1 hypothetical protein AFK69_13505 [Xenorhabdus sp. GDc328]